MPETKAMSCPNCSQPAMRTGNEITCENCDATFVITKKQGAKVKEFGQIQDHENRIQVLEKSVKPVEPQKPEEESEENDL